MSIAERTVAERRTVRAPFPASTAVSNFDLVWWDNANKFTKPASLRTDLGSAAANQADFTPIFFGISLDQRLVTETSVTVVATAPTGPSDRTVNPEGIFDADCVSATWEFGDLVGIARDGTNNVNFNQQVVKVTDPTLAIGFCIKREPTAVTKVRCFLSAYIYGWWKTIGSTGQAVQPNLLANFRNMIDGGDFTTNPWQRGTSQAADITSTLTYAADRWFIVAGASSAIDWSQVADATIAGFNQAFKIQRKAANADLSKVSVGQVFESADCIKTQGQLVTLSFWAKKGANYSGGNLTVALNHSTTAGNDTAAHLVAASTNWQAVPTVVNTTQALTTAWVRYTFTGAVPATATQLGILFQFTPTGTAGSDDSISIQGVQLEIGATATPFEHRDIEVELALCQRYYVRFTEANGAVFGMGAPSAVNTQFYSVYLPTPLRSNPTVTWTVGGFKLNIDGGGSTTTPTTPAAGATHSPTVITLTTANTLTAAAHSIALVGTGTTGFFDASADF
jgi:hypothetical protein